MAFEQEILRVLTFADFNGLHLSKISKHVFNASNSFFQPLDFEDVHAEVSSFLLKQSKNPCSPIEKIRRGVYRLNPLSTETSQLMLKFRTVEEETKDEPIACDNSLSLFDT